MLIAAALVLFVLGLLHSVLAEPMLFRHLPRASGLPALGFPPIVGSPDPSSHSLRASWHNLTLFGWTLALIVGRFAALPALGNGERFVLQAISGSLVASALIWFVATRGKHMGWVGFVLAAVLCWLGAR